MSARLWRQRVTVAGCLLVGLVLTPLVHAGRSCNDPQPPKTQTVERGLNLALRTTQALDKSGAQVVLLARAGQDLSQYGLVYSHLGLAYKQPDGQGKTVWRVLHKLNECGTAVAAIYKQGVGNFFLDDLWRYEAAWVVPTPDVQARLLEVLTDPQRSVRLHHAPYSMLSYAWGQKYQQSNQWAIETLAMALDPQEVDMAKASRQGAQAWLNQKGYLPGVLTIGPLTRLGARVTRANVAFDDHPNEKRFSDRIETITVDSVFAWMLRSGLAQGKVMTLGPN